jgi:excisionase family DNA binding protein
MALNTGFVGVKQIAVYERGAKESIYRWGDSKGFPAHRVGRLLCFKRSEVDEWVTANNGDDSRGQPAREAKGNEIARTPACRGAGRQVERHDEQVWLSIGS